MATKIIFSSIYGPEKLEDTLECYISDKNQLVIDLNDCLLSDTATIILDKQTAIRFSRELRKQISLMVD